jgi:flavorubredoxin
MTPELSQFLDNLYDLNKTGKIKVTDKKGAVFGSYAWDGGWHTESIERRLLDIGLKMIAPPLSINEDPKTYKIRREDLDECLKLGRLVAKTV